eukprot:1157935-Pelagomonas_calceolata.AAC.5
MPGVWPLCPAHAMLRVYIPGFMVSTHLCHAWRGPPCPATLGVYISGFRVSSYTPVSCQAWLPMSRQCEVKGSHF